MSTRMASKLAGLLGAPRSMNVRRKESEKWTLETPVCLARSLRTCAASAPSAVEPARGICDSERWPASRSLPASSTSRTRKPRLRPSGGSMPCAPGWLVRSVARHGGRTDEGAAGMRADVACKVNFARAVKKILSHTAGPSDSGVGILTIRQKGIAPHPCQRLGLT